MTGSVPSSASVPPALWVTVGEDRYGEHGGLGVSTNYTESDCSLVVKNRFSVMLKKVSVRIYPLPGFDDNQVHICDSAQTEAPLVIDIDAFMLAWTEQDYERRNSLSGRTVMAWPYVA